MSWRTKGSPMTETADTRPWFRQLDATRWRAFFAGWLGYALDGFDFVLITYVLTDVAKSFDVSLAQASWLITAAFASRWLGGGVLGSVADRFGRKKAMMASVVLYSVGTFCCGLAWDYWSFLAFRLVVGLGMAGEYGASSTYVVESWPAALKNKASAFLISGFSVGGLLASVTYPLVVPSLGWRALFFIGLAPVVVTLFIRKYAPESEEWQNAVKTSSEKVSLLGLFTRKRIAVTLSLIVLVFAAFCSNWPVSSLLPTYLKEIGYQPGAVGQVMFIATFGTLLGTVFAGFLGDRLGTKRAYVTSLAVSLAFIVPVFAIGNRSIVALGVFIFLLEWTNLGISGILPKYLAEHFAPQVRGAGLGFIYNIGALGGGLSPVFGTLLGATFGLGGAVAALTVFWTALLLVLIAVDAPLRIGRVFARETVAVHAAKEGA